MLATIEPAAVFYKPSDAELATMRDDMKDYVERGGLVFEYADLFNFRRASK